MKEVSWKEAFKYGYKEAIIASIFAVILVLPVTVVIIPILVLNIIVGTIVFWGIFIFSIWDARRQLMNPKPSSHYYKYRTYGNYADYSDSGCDCGGYCDCGDCGGDGGC